DGQAQVAVRVENGLTQVEVERVQARLGEGLLTASGAWSAEGAFAARFRLEGASLETLTPYLPVEYRLTGRASLEGEASGTLEHPTASVELKGEQIALNGVPLGDLEGRFSYHPQPLTPLPTQAGDDWGIVRAQLALRTPDGAARISELVYDFSDSTLRVEAATEALPIDWLRRVARALPDAVPPAVAERIETLQGRVQAQLRIEGAVNEPTVRLTLNAETLEWRGQSLGSLALQAEWQGASEVDDLRDASPPERATESLRRLRTQRAHLQRLRWQAENTRLEASATYTPERLDADLEIAQFPLRWARLWDPSLPEVDGDLDLSLIAQG
ncbi:MAG: hypothetical protein ACK4UU_09215, partial [Fimbriimonadales bacterium]